jgi:hypothetical protein
LHPRIAQALFKIRFLVFNTGKPSRYEVFFRWNFNFVKSKASVAILGPKNAYEKYTFLGSCRTVKT